MVCTQFVGYKDLYCQYWHPKQHRACQESSHFLLVISYNQYQQFYPCRPGDFIPKIAVWENLRETPNAYISLYHICVLKKEHVPVFFPSSKSIDIPKCLVLNRANHRSSSFVDTNKASFWWIDPEIPTVIYIQKNVFFLPSRGCFTVPNWCERSLVGEVPLGRWRLVELLRSWWLGWLGR